MGNVSGKKEEVLESSGIKNQYMEYGHGQFQDSMVQSFSHSPMAYQVPIVPLQRPDQNGIPTMITWSRGGHEVSVEGSWDGWKTRDYLQRTDKDFTIMKVLPSGVYRYHFIVDGQWTYAPDLPHECDGMGNVFNVLDLQDSVPEVLNNINWSEPPASPESSYNNAPFSSVDFNEKLPDLPPLLHQTPLALDQPSSFGGRMETHQEPLPAVLNHLYIEKGSSSQSMAVLSSTNRFRKKYVTAVLYKSLKKLKS